MQQFVDAIRPALHVLAALAQRRQPLPGDVEELRRLAPEGEYASLGDMAYRVVEEALRRYTQERQASSEQLD